MTTQQIPQQLVKLAKEVVDEWHADNRNFEREMTRGTPKWLSLARQIAKAA